MLRTACTLLIAFSAVGCSENEPSSVKETLDGPAKYGAPTAEFIHAIAVDTPSNSRPISFGGTVAPSTVSPGQPAILVIRVNTAPNWHINEVGRRSELLIPTSLSIDAPMGIELVDDWQLPSAEQIEDADGPVYHDDFVFFHHLRVATDATTGTHEITCTVTYQACDNMKCLQPTSEKVVLSVNVD